MQINFLSRSLEILLSMLSHYRRMHSMCMHYINIAKDEENFFFLALEEKKTNSL